MSQPPYPSFPPAPPNPPPPPASAPGTPGKLPPERRQFFGQSSREIARGALHAAEFLPPVARVLRVLGVTPQVVDAGAPAGAGPQAAAPRRWPVMTLPPGAVPDFYAVCTRCNDCVKACPHWAIRKAGPELGAQLDGVPLIYPGDSPCKLCADLPCVAACEPQALRPLPIPAIRLGALAVIDFSACHVSKGRACDICVQACPVGAQALIADAAGRPVVLANGCTGCGVCVQECPTSCIHMVAVGITGSKE